MTAFQDNTKQVLRMIADHPMIRGVELMKAAGITQPVDLVNSVNPLVRDGLVRIKGSFAKTDQVKLTRFYVPPSGVQYAKMKAL